RALRSDVLAPDLAPAEKDALFRRKAVEGLRRLAGGARQIGHQRDAQAAVVRGVLPERQLAVQLDVVDRGEARILVDEALRAILERLRVGRRPPVLQVAARVE